MNANEAPEKIYIPTAGNELHYHMTCPNNDFQESIEYTRTDVFIDKACEWIETNMDDYIHVEYDTVTGKPTNEAHIAHKKVVEDFIKHMKGEEVDLDDKGEWKNTGDFGSTWDPDSPDYYPD